jgi:uncharacterized membrane protein
MALRDWHGKHIGMMWALGIGISWLVGRLGVAAVSGGARAAAPVADSAQVAAAPQVSAGGAPLWTTGVVLVILTILLIITVRWVRGHILDT